LVQAECLAPHIINGGGKWVELSIEADPIYQTILIAAEKAFWRAVGPAKPLVCSIVSLRNHGSKRAT
jgi:hypothetical protein